MLDTKYKAFGFFHITMYIMWNFKDTECRYYLFQSGVHQCMCIEEFSSLWYNKNLVQCHLTAYNL